MKLTKFGLPLIAAGAMFATGCEIDQTQEARLPDVDIEADGGELPEYDIVKTEDGRLPDVDVDVRGGQLPKFDVDGPSVSVGEKKVDVTVPDVDVDVKGEEKTFTVPTIDVDLPEDEDDSPNY